MIQVEHKGETPLILYEVKLEHDPDFASHWHYVHANTAMDAAHSFGLEYQKKRGGLDHCEINVEVRISNAQDAGTWSFRIWDEPMTVELPF